MPSGAQKMGMLCTPHSSTFPLELMAKANTISNENITRRRLKAHGYSILRNAQSELRMRRTVCYEIRAERRGVLMERG